MPPEIWALRRLRRPRHLAAKPLPPFHQHHTAASLGSHPGCLHARRSASDHDDLLPLLGLGVVVKLRLGHGPVDRAEHRQALVVAPDAAQ